MEASKAPAVEAEEEKPVWFGDSGKDGANEYFPPSPAEIQYCAKLLRFSSQSATRIGRMYLPTDKLTGSC